MAIDPETQIELNKKSELAGNNTFTGTNSFLNALTVAATPVLETHVVRKLELDTVAAKATASLTQASSALATATSADIKASRVANEFATISQQVATATGAATTAATKASEASTSATAAEKAKTDSQGVLSQIQTIQTQLDEIKRLTGIDATNASQSASTATQAKTDAETARDAAQIYGQAAGIDANGNQIIEGNQRVRGISTHDQVINALGGVSGLPYSNTNSSAVSYGEVFGMFDNSIMGSKGALVATTPIHSDALYFPGYGLFNSGNKYLVPSGSRYVDFKSYPGIAYNAYNYGPWFGNVFIPISFIFPRSFGPHKIVISNKSLIDKAYDNINDIEAVLTGSSDFYLHITCTNNEDRFRMAGRVGNVVLPDILSVSNNPIVVNIIGIAITQSSMHDPNKGVTNVWLVYETYNKLRTVRLFSGTSFTGSALNFRIYGMAINGPSIASVILRPHISRFNAHWTPFLSKYEVLGVNEEITQ